MLSRTRCQPTFSIILAVRSTVISWHEICRSSFPRSNSQDPQLAIIPFFDPPKIRKYHRPCLNSCSISSNLADMPPRIRSNAISPFLLSRRAYYSTETNAPLIRVTNLAAPSSGHIRILELNRPAARNAISKALLSALRSEVDDVRNQYGPHGEEKSQTLGHGGDASRARNLGPTRALVVASAVDTCFCAGADLKERKGFSQQEYVPKPQTFQLSMFSLTNAYHFPL